MSFVSIYPRSDGFGAQFQNILTCILFAEHHGLYYIHVPINSIEHNYNNDPNYLSKIEELINLQNYFPFLSNINIITLTTDILYPYFENNIDKCLESDALKKIKKIFWSNKNKNHFNNNCINISVHIRRKNECDNRVEGTNNPDDYYINLIKKIRVEYKDKDIKFNIYSQGSIVDFEKYISDDTVFHINEDICSTFIGLVGADILIMSASSLSYSAAILNDGIIYYLPFWHKPAKKWIDGSKI
jgi:hypothetical protein